MLGPALIAEFIKLKRSKITWITWLAYSIMPLAGGLFMWIVKEPQRASRLGLVGQKARFAVLAADWPAYFGMLNQMSCAGGMLLLAIIAAYVFGREYAEGTAKNMLTLPVARPWFGVAKLAVALAWFGGLTLSFIAEAFLVGSLLGLPGLSLPVAAASVRDLLVSGLLGFLLVPAVTWIATLGRGYLPPIGFTIFMLILGNVFGATGWGKWFPWSIVPMLTGMTGPRQEVLAPDSVAVVLLTFAAGLAATLWQLAHEDSNQ